MPCLVLLRHGQSQWNLENRFTGWTDVDLTEEGSEQALMGGKLLARDGYRVNMCFTSVLKRAVRTLWLALDAMDRMWVPYQASWRLNERHYGALQGLNKADTAEKYGKVQVQVWRRSFDTPPPLVKPDDKRHPSHDPRYAGLPPNELPAGESLKDTLDRVMPYWHQTIEPALKLSGCVLVAAHGNSLRAVAKHLMGVADKDIAGLEIPTGNPLALELDARLGVRSAKYLDPKRAAPLP